MDMRLLLIVIGVILFQIAGVVQVFYRRMPTVQFLIAEGILLGIGAVTIAMGVTKSLPFSLGLGLAFAVVSLGGLVSIKIWSSRKIANERSNSARLGE